MTVSAALLPVIVNLAVKKYMDPPGSISGIFAFLQQEALPLPDKPSIAVLPLENSSFTYRGKPVKVQKVGKELGVRYVLERAV